MATRQMKETRAAEHDYSLTEGAKRGVILLQTAYRTELSDDEFRLYVEALKHLIPQEVDAAVARCIRERKFFPTIAEIFESAGRGMSDSEVEALAEWERVQEYVKEFGYAWNMNRANPQPEKVRATAEVTETIIGLKGEKLTRRITKEFWKDVPQFSERTKYAINSIGGLQVLEPTDKPQSWSFTRKAFIAAYGSYEAVNNKLALGSGERKQLKG